VVAYDASGGCYAARLWWMLRWLGHDAVAVLDGGWAAWINEGRATETAWPTVTAREFKANLRPKMVADAAEVARVIADGSDVLLDARAADRFRGENESIDPVGGHIPTACNAAWAGNLASDGKFLSPQALADRFAAVMPGDAVASQKIIAYCGSGVTAAHTLLALEIAGIAGARLYPGSWSEWITDPARPVAVGEQDGIATTTFNK
jgi:thiosulfate/3-mercaptopyruvate sulfurtransferase